MAVPIFYPRLRYYYRTIIPLFEKPKVAAYTMLTLSFFTIAFFGIFAIKPTLATIAQLKKQIEDQKSVLTRLNDKMTQLRTAEVAYENVRPDIDAVLTALPDKPQTASLLEKLNSTLKNNSIDVTILQFSQIELREPIEASSSAGILGFALSGKASYDNIVNFVNVISQMDRIVSIDSLNIAKTEGDLLTMTIQGKAYILWKGKGK
ncbi:type 4a pilus biogenesis protein PilO [Candidatus Microgenomates bacterium]|nr:type 4a pilus biogenesis protein PilO [Candidatus Microgenomates bacterium]